jgi:hypothetical protein
MEDSKADESLSQKDFMRLLLCKIGTCVSYRSQPSRCKFIHVLEGVFLFIESLLNFTWKVKKKESRTDMFARAEKGERILPKM